MTILTREDVEHRIANGDALVIYGKSVLKLNGWIKYHPGGDKAVHHLIGKDATDEMLAYHSDETVQQFCKWKIGEIPADQEWVNFIPPIQGGLFRRAKQDSEAETKMCGEPAELVVPEVSADTIPVPGSTVVDPARLSYDQQLVQDDLKSLPALDYKTQQFLRDEYNKLHQYIIDNGYYQCDYYQYFKEFVRISSLFALAFYLLFVQHRFFLSAVALGLGWQQLVFIAHDAGHISITHHYQADNVIGMTVASFIGGLSLGWWKRNHNVHHLITNDPVHDPDIQHLPFFAVSTRLFNNIYSTYYEKFLWFDAFAQKLIPLQNYLYYPILCFGRFNLYRLSWQHVLMGQGPRSGKAAWFRYYELAGLTFFNWWFFYLIIYKTIDNNFDRFMYVMVSHITTMIVHVQITLSHFAMSTSDLGVSESFASRQIRTTMDVDCPEWFDFFHGGLQFQAIHHLFPRVPRHNFRKIQPFVIKFCEKVGLKYSIYGFVNGNEIVIGKLGQIAKQAKILSKCSEKMKMDALKEGRFY